MASKPNLFQDVPQYKPAETKSYEWQTIDLNVNKSKIVDANTAEMLGIPEGSILGQHSGTKPLPEGAKLLGSNKNGQIAYFITPEQQEMLMGVGPSMLDMAKEMKAIHADEFKIMTPGSIIAAMDVGGLEAKLGASVKSKSLSDLLKEGAPLTIPNAGAKVTFAPKYKFSAPAPAYKPFTPQLILINWAEFGYSETQAHWLNQLLAPTAEHPVGDNLRFLSAFYRAVAKDKTDRRFLSTHSPETPTFHLRASTLLLSMTLPGSDYSQRLPEEHQDLLISCLLRFVQKDLYIETLDSGTKPKTIVGAEADSATWLLDTESSFEGYATELAKMQEKGEFSMDLGYEPGFKHYGKSAAQLAVDLDDSEASFKKLAKILNAAKDKALEKHKPEFKPINLKASGFFAAQYGGSVHWNPGPKPEKGKNAPGQQTWKGKKKGKS